MKLYFLNILLAWDITWNVRFGGSPSQTISGRLYDHRDVWIARRIMGVVDWVFARLGDVDHCKTSYEQDMTKRAEVL